MPRPGEESAPPAGERGWPGTVYVPAPGSSPEDLARRLAAAIEVHRDFPRPGLRFPDPGPVFRDPELFDDVLTRLAEAAGSWGADWLAAVEPRGYLLGAPLADRLGLPLAPVRKGGGLPGETVGRRYDTEDGSDRIELRVDAVPDGRHVLLVDDLLATGATLRAAAGLVEELGGRVAGIVVLVELEAPGGRHMLTEYNLLSLLSL